MELMDMEVMDMEVLDMEVMDWAMLDTDTMAMPDTLTLIVLMLVILTMVSTKEGQAAQDVSKLDLCLAHLEPINKVQTPIATLGPSVSQLYMNQIPSGYMCH